MPKLQGTLPSRPARNRFEKALRRWPGLGHALAVLLLYLVVATAIGYALVPGLALVQVLFRWTSRLSFLPACLLRGFALGLAWFVSGMALLVVVAVYNRVLPTTVRPFKGGYYTLEALPWFLHNGLFYLVRFTFMPFVTLTPFGVLFLKAMGMKIGRRAFINTEYLSDLALITIGDDAVIGGSVRICAHYGGGGNLVVAPVTIGDRATLGLACCIMGDVVIGPDAVILPESVVLPGSRVGSGETWGGVPARPIPREEMDRLKLILRGERPAALT